jgi:hypothetical protein
MGQVPAMDVARDHVVHLRDHAAHLRVVYDSTYLFREMPDGSSFPK